MKTAEELLNECKIQLLDFEETFASLEAIDKLIKDIDDYLNQPRPTLPSDEEINKQSKISCKGNSHTMRYLPMLNQFRQGAKWMRSLCQAKLAESEREMKEFRQLARLISALNEDHENFKCIAGHIQLARKLLTTTQ